MMGDKARLLSGHVQGIDGKVEKCSLARPSGIINLGCSENLGTFQLAIPTHEAESVAPRSTLTSGKVQSSQLDRSVTLGDYLVREFSDRARVAAIDRISKKFMLRTGAIPYSKMLDVSSTTAAVMKVYGNDIGSVARAILNILFAVKPKGFPHCHIYSDTRFRESGTRSQQT